MPVSFLSGEYVAVEKLESSYKKNLLAEQIWVYGNSFESVLLAVVVPSNGLLDWAKANSIPGDMAEVCKNPKANAYMLAVGVEIWLVGGQVAVDLMSWL